MYAMPDELYRALHHGRGAVNLQSAYNKQNSATGKRLARLVNDKEQVNGHAQIREHTSIHLGHCT